MLRTNITHTVQEIQCWVGRTLVVVLAGAQLSYTSVLTGLWQVTPHENHLGQGRGGQ